MLDESPAKLKPAGASENPSAATPPKQTSAGNTTADSQQQQQQQADAGAKERSSSSQEAAANKRQQQQQQQQHDWSIGSTYHDEENLAALLIERDQLTGQIKVDGTIGNDFVIKPMPRATIEALMAANQQAQVQGQPQLQLQPQRRAPADERAESTSVASRQQASEPTTDELKRLAGHLHDDDPHDDDEMFLDEDEALELANHLNATAPHSTSAQTNPTAPQPVAALSASLPQQQQQQQQQRKATLSKAASERKWRKYRKLMAQTQVPKLNGVNEGGVAAATAPAGQQRARRHAPQSVHSKQEDLVRHMSHHIIYKQRPSSEASSSEHRHSFMLAPGQQTMEEMVRRFPGKRSTGDNVIDEQVGGSRAASRLSATSEEADYAHDPMGGQFYLEPGSITGFERAGYADWSFAQPAADAAAAAAGGRHALAAPPPYAFNSTTRADLLNSTSSQQTFKNTHQHQQHARFKRHLGPNPRLAAPSSHRAAHTPIPNRRHKRQAPDVVWPEVLLVVDYDSFLLHGGDSREVKRYFVSFWNGVDLRYKLLVNPHIRISLAGMIVAKDRDATPYLERNRLRAPNADAVDAAGALTDMGKYLYREDRLPTYDLAVVITKLDMCRRRYEGGRCNRGTAGFAYVGGACVVNKRLEKVNSVAIIEDSGGFSGIIVAAHEVGHL